MLPQEVKVISPTACMRTARVACASPEDCIYTAAAHKSVQTVVIEIKGLGLYVPIYEIILYINGIQYFLGTCGSSHFLDAYK